MNTINSVYYGWGFLILCGGGSYYFAKRSINSERYSRQSQENELQRRRNRAMAEATHNKIGAQGGGGSSVGGGSGGGASQVGSNATTGGGMEKAGKGEVGEQEGMGMVRGKLEERDQKKEGKRMDKAQEKEQKKEPESEFESSRPFRSRKGDRFS